MEQWKTEILDGLKIMKNLVQKNIDDIEKSENIIEALNILVNSELAVGKIEEILKR